MDRLQLRVIYSKVPVTWALEQDTMLIDKFSASVPSKLGPDGGIVYIQGNGAPIFQALANAEKAPSETFGISFPEYYSDVINKTDPDPIIFKKYMFIYNIGDEPALNPKFATQLLNGLISKIKAYGGWVFLVGDLSYTDFSRKYGITTKNRFRIPSRASEAL